MAVQADVTARLDDGTAETKFSALHALNLLIEINRCDCVLGDQFVIGRCGLLAEHRASKKERGPATQAGCPVNLAHRASMLLRRHKP